MKNLKVKVRNIPITDLMRLDALMPTREFKVWAVAENVFQIRIEKMICTTVEVVDGEFVFDFATEGYPGYWADRLREGMLLLNPELDPDRILWIVVFPWYDAWSYAGSPKSTKEGALENLVTAFSKPGAMLVGFKASEWPCQILKVDRSFAVRGGSKDDYNVSLNDEGEKLFRFTALENFVKNEE